MPLINNGWNYMYIICVFKGWTLSSYIAPFITTATKVHITALESTSNTGKVTWFFEVSEFVNR